jgi:hypothetical protein
VLPKSADSTEETLGSKKREGREEEGGDAKRVRMLPPQHLDSVALRMRDVRLQGDERQRLWVMTCRVACRVVVRHCSSPRQPLAGRSLFLQDTDNKEGPVTVFPLPPPLPPRRVRDKLRFSLSLPLSSLLFRSRPLYARAAEENAMKAATRHKRKRRSSLGPLSCACYRARMSRMRN